MLPRIFFLAFVWALVAEPARADSGTVVGMRARSAPAHKSLLTPDQQQHILDGVQRILKMDFDGAQSEFETLEKKVPGHPFAYFGYASVAWLRYIYENEQSDQSLMEPFDEAVTTGVRAANVWVKKHPDDAEGWMARGAINGLYGRMLVTRRRFVKGYFTARTAMKSVRKALELDPELHDAKLGVGMYDYYTDVYPHFIGVLAKIVMGGNRERGIRILHEVAEKGRYTNWTAKMLLVEIYNHDPFGSADPEKAVAIMKDVRSSFPDSAMLHSAELVSKLNAKRYGEVERGTVEFLERVDSGMYPALERAKGLVILGHARWFLGKPEEALTVFQRATGIKLKGNLSRYAVAALIRAGNVLDTLGRRGDAKYLYARAKRQPDHWGFKRLASRYMSKPFSYRSPPFSIIPRES
jgi:tetratricopeptide (TPR) repeat protein